jgi:hypothetical protein
MVHIGLLLLDQACAKLPIAGHLWRPRRNRADWLAVKLVGQLELAAGIDMIE